MTTTKNKIKKGKYKDWVLCTLGLHKTSTALYKYVKNKIRKYIQVNLQQKPFTQAEFSHINSGVCCMRIGLLSKVEEIKNPVTKKFNWEWKHNCKTCRSAFQKILTLHTGESRLHLENCDDTSIIPLEWAIAKMFMPHGNKDNKRPEDTDPAALLNCMLNCDLFTNAIRRAHKKELTDARNNLYHSPDNIVREVDKTKYFYHMVHLLKDASHDKDVDETIRFTIKKDIEDIKKMKDSEISITLYDDALKLKKIGIHDDLERCMNSIENEKDIAQLQNLIRLSEKTVDLQASNVEMKNMGLYREGIERIKEKLSGMKNATRDMSEEVQRDLENFQRVELKRVVDQLTCLSATLINENQNLKETVNHFNILIVVIVVGTVLFTLMFRIWVLCY